MASLIEEFYRKKKKPIDPITQPVSTITEFYKKKQQQNIPDSPISSFYKQKQQTTEELLQSNIGQPISILPTEEPDLTWTPPRTELTLRAPTKIEEHYQKPMDTEWAVEKEKIYIVQARAVTTFKPKEIETTVTEEKTGKIHRGG